VPRIPLSSTPFDGVAIGKILQDYEGQPAMNVVADFEKKISEYAGSAHVVALNSGTSAIHLGLKALGVMPGDVVLAPTSTYIATVNPICYLGAVPVFVDCESATWNVDPSLLEEAVKSLVLRGKRPACLIVVHSYGMPASWDELRAICARHEIPILEDAAAAMGAWYKEQRAGTLGDIAVFSFNNNKAITTYGGGALVTKNQEILSKTAFWASQSRENKPYYEHTQVGYNYRMSPLNAAAGLVALKDIDKKIQCRRDIYDHYRERLESRIDSQWPAEPSGFIASRWLTCARFKELEINDIVVGMFSVGIECRRAWNPMHKQPLFLKNESFLNGFSEKLFAEGLCLPSSKPELVDEVCDALVRLL
jgi:dTDP-4-amino-4,6-dideoxygalactose transaminase